MPRRGRRALGRRGGRAADRAGRADAPRRRGRRARARRRAVRGARPAGHADGHIALLGRHSGRLFGGDVLLDEITPNVGRWDDNEPDPLGRYLETLGRIEELAPAVVYPGHRSVIERPARARRRSRCTTPCGSTSTSAPCATALAAPTRSPSTSGAAGSASTSSASRWRGAGAPRAARGLGRAVQVEPGPLLTRTRAQRLTERSTSASSPGRPRNGE